MVILALGGVALALPIILIIAGLKLSMHFYHKGAVGIKKTVLDQDGDTSYEYHPIGCSCASCIAW